MDAITAQPYRRQKLREMGVEREEAGVERGEFEVEKEGVNMNRKESELENVQEEENEKEEEEDRDESFFPLLSDLTPLKSHSGGCGDGTNGSPAHTRDKQDKVPYFSNVMCEEPVVGTVGDVIYNGGVGEGSNDLGSAVDGASNSGGRDRDGSHGRGDGDGNGDDKDTIDKSGRRISRGSGGGSGGTELLVAAVAVGVMAFAASQLTSLPLPPLSSLPSTNIIPPPPLPLPVPPTTPASATTQPLPTSKPPRCLSPLPSLPSAAVFLSHLDMDIDSDEEVSIVTTTTTFPPSLYHTLPRHNTLGLCERYER